MTGLIKVEEKHGGTDQSGGKTWQGRTNQGGDKTWQDWTRWRQNMAGLIKLEKKNIAGLDKTEAKYV